MVCTLRSATRCTEEEEEEEEEEVGGKSEKPEGKRGTWISGGLKGIIVVWSEEAFCCGLLVAFWQ